jgi:hypothetical protein
MTRARLLIVTALVAVLALCYAGELPASPPAPPPAPAVVRQGLPRPARIPFDTSVGHEARALAGVRPGLVAPTSVPGTMAAEAGPGAAVTWSYLSDLPWTMAKTGALTLADQAEPRRDQGFLRRTPLVIAGQPYSKGLGAFPLSEIEYALPPDTVAFHALVGINDEPIMEGGSVTFHVYADNVELYASEVVRRGVPPIPVDLSIAGVQRLRLVIADAGDGDLGDVASWVDAAIARDPATGGSATPLAASVATAETARRDTVVGEDGHLYALAAAELAAADAVLAGSAQAPGPPESAASSVHLAAVATAPPAGGAASQGASAAASRPQLAVDGARAAWDDGRDLLLLGNETLLLTLGLGSAEHGYLTVVDRRSGRLLLYDENPTVRLASGRRLALHEDTALDTAQPYTLAATSDAALGRGVEATVRLPLKDGDGRVAVRLAVYGGQGYFTYQLGVEGLPAAEQVQGYDYFTATSPGGFVVGDMTGYLADRSRLWDGMIRDDGFTRRASLEGTKPLVLWNGPDNALLATMLDCVDAPALATFRREPGRAVANVGLGFDDVLAERRTTSPRLLLETLPSGDLRQGTANYRRIMAALYPPAPAPDWLRNQLGSWYIYGPTVTDPALRQQIDYIATYLADMGPWHVVIDAGWHVAYGQADAEFRAVDADKFPDGIRALVDYAHARDVKVVLYLPTGYVHDGRGDGEWLALPELINAHPEWLIPIYTQGDVGRYLLNYRLPAVQAHVAHTIREALVTYDADGISMDGLSDAEGQLIPFPLRQTWRGTPPIQRAGEIYKLFGDLIHGHKPDAYIETGWMTPLCANPYATTFRYADEIAEFDSPYPFGGFLTHLDYAILQRMIFGQRANMGANFGDPNRADALTWLRGALALGVQATLSFDLTRLAPERLAEYRAHLTHYYPFAGETRFDAAMLPTSFATRRGPLVYLGVVNRDPAPRTIAVSLAELGLDGAATYTAYDAEGRAFRQVAGGFEAALPAKSFRLYVLRGEPGVLWTTSSFEERTAEGGLDLRVDGPADVPGRLWLVGPAPAAVLLDGTPLPALPGAQAAGPGYLYDAAAGVLHVRYPHLGPRQLAVRW